MRLLHLALAGLVINLALLIPGLLLPVLTVTGHLEPAGIAEVAPPLLDSGISEAAIKSFKPMLSPAASLLGSDAEIRKMLLAKLTPQIVESLSKDAKRIQVYEQSRSIIGSIQRLFEVGSYTAAILILLFSVIVPFGKIIMVLRALSLSDIARRHKLLKIIAAVSKWSMADVFAVALFITFLAARASQAPLGPDEPPPLLTFNSTFGVGFFWFAAYCLVSLAINQYALKRGLEAEPIPGSAPEPLR